MSRISFFQRYSQRENHATNNVLLALRYVYEGSPQRLQQVLQTLLPEADFQIGLSFGQQERESFSIPDAVITQTRLRFFFETKIRGDLEDGQIRRHIDSIHSSAVSNESLVLLGLSPRKPNDSLSEAWKQYAAERRVQFEAITFAQLIQVLVEEFKEYETAERAIIDDLAQYLDDEGLVPHDYEHLFVVLSSQTYDRNLADKVYYEPAHRSSKNALGYLGLYKDRSVRAVGKIRLTFEAELSMSDERWASISRDDQELIRRVIEESPYPDLGSSLHRYYLIDSFVETDFRKRTKYGLWKSKRFNLRDYLGGDVEKMSVQQIAHHLRSVEWE